MIKNIHLLNHIKEKRVAERHPDSHNFIKIKNKGTQYYKMKCFKNDKHVDFYQHTIVNKSGKLWYERITGYLNS